MKAVPAIYLGRVVEKKNFRAFIYGINGERRLVESWDEFEANMQSGLWFASLEDAGASKAINVVSAKKRTRQKPKLHEVEKVAEEVIEEVYEDECVLQDDDSVFEVKDGS